MRRTAAALTALTLAAAITAPANAQYRSDGATYVKAKNKKAARAAAQPRQIACTVFGCNPVPPGCHPARGFDFAGNPLSYDLIVCR